MYTELYSLKAELNDNLLYNLNVDVNAYSRQEQFKFYEFVLYGTDEVLNISFNVECSKDEQAGLSYKSYRDNTYLNIDIKENMLVCKALKEEALIINCTLFDAECIAKLIVEYITNVLYYYPYTNHQC